MVVRPSMAANRPDDHDRAPADGVVVPPSSLSPDALRRVIEEFVTREGTEYGTADVDLADKVTQVERQLRQGDAAIVFDPETASVSIVPARALRSASAESGEDSGPE